MKNKFIINADQGTHIINPNIYGHFAEHLGRCIYEGFWVGEDSPIPNVRGIRQDVVEALRRIKPPVLRWPGGCFADEYHWRDGVGPRESRPSIVNTHWGGVTENNHFGTHEFFDLCEMLGAEPYINGNVGSGTVYEMQQWVEYCTLANGSSPMANLRAENGREQPWKLKYFGVGNESWGCGGNMSPEFYADNYRQYQTFVRHYGDNRVFKIACGANVADYNWTEVLMRRAAGHMDGLTLHHYTMAGPWENKGSATEFNEKEYFDTLRNGLRMEELVMRHSGIMDRYDPQKRVALIVDEWGTWWNVEPGTNPGFLYQQNTQRDALVAGLTLNIFNAHCDRVRMANIAQTINVLQAMILTDGPRILLTPTYHVFEMWKVHQGSQLLPSHLECEKYTQGDAAVPGVSASASRDENGRVHVTLCHMNPTQSGEINCEVRGTSVGTVTGRVLSAGTLNARNTFDAADAVQPRALTPEDIQVEGNRITVKLPPASLAVLTVEG